MAFSVEVRRVAVWRLCEQAWRSSTCRFFVMGSSALCSAVHVTYTDIPLASLCLEDCLGIEVYFWWNNLRLT